jgi:molybdopterin synthase sulfur carrier subunit
MERSQTSTRTITVHVKFFASLRERMGRGEQALHVPAGSTILDVWHHLAGQTSLPPNIVVACNMEYADVSRIVEDGEEVAFFPPVTGGACAFRDTSRSI